MIKLLKKIKRLLKFAEELEEVTAFNASAVLIKKDGSEEIVKLNRPFDDSLVFPETLCGPYNSNEIPLSPVKMVEYRLWNYNDQVAFYKEI